MKTQTVRLLDVLAFGPFMIYAATRKSRLSQTERALLAIVGAGTIAYNLQNYNIERERERLVAP